MTEPCAVCQRDPKKMNSSHSTCSHVDCPHRRNQWADTEPVAHQIDRLDDSRYLDSLFDRKDRP